MFLHKSQLRKNEGRNTHESECAELKATANIMRQDIVRMINAAGSGHPGGSLSAADIVAALYFNVMDIDPEAPKKENRDKFVLSKGHAAPVLYAALANRGYFAKEELLKLRKFVQCFKVTQT